MDKKTIVASLLQIAEDLDMKNMPAEADIVTDVAQSVADAPMSAAEAFRQKLDVAEKISAMEEERKETVEAVINRFGELFGGGPLTDEEEMEYDQMLGAINSFSPREIYNSKAFDANESALREGGYENWDAIEEMLDDQRMEEQGGPPATTRDLVDMGWGR